MGQYCRIEVGHLVDHVYVKVRGYASFHEAAEITQYLDSIEITQQPTSYAFDLKDCEKMDSTFMGLMARLAGEAGQKAFSVAQCGGPALQCLKDLGLTQIVTMVGVPEHIPESLVCLTPNAIQREKKENAIRRGHETLSQLNENNRLVFKDVIDVLKDK